MKIDVSSKSKVMKFLQDCKDGHYPNVYFYKQYHEVSIPRMQVFGEYFTYYVDCGKRDYQFIHGRLHTTSYETLSTNFVLKKHSPPRCHLKVMNNEPGWSMVEPSEVINWLTSSNQSPLFEDSRFNYEELINVRM